ncbi:HPr family phosphocarrier protein [Verrucomicrobiota bacterium]
MSNETKVRATGNDSRADREIKVLNQYGIHARPAALLVKTAQKFQADITIEKGDMKVSGKSIMGLMTLEAGCGASVKVIAEGVDAEQALEAIQKLFDQKFFEE